MTVSGHCYYTILVCGSCTFQGLIVVITRVFKGYVVTFLYTKYFTYTQGIALKLATIASCKTYL